MKRFAAYFCALFLSIAIGANALTFHADVRRVIDGDTIRVADESNQLFTIRLSGIDAPERAQTFGRHATQRLYEFLAGKKVLVDVDDIDRHGRLVARVSCDGKDAGLDLLLTGHAWVYRQYMNRIPSGVAKLYLEAEANAQRHRVGLWSDSSRVPPWLLRHSLHDEPEASPQDRTGIIIGNRKSRIYHRPDCPAYLKVSPANRVYFHTAADAAGAGYRLALNCAK